MINDNTWSIHIKLERIKIVLVLITQVAVLITQVAVLITQVAALVVAYAVPKTLSQVDEGWAIIGVKEHCTVHMWGAWSS